jgi:hypothetical protein
MARHLVGFGLFLSIVTFFGLAYWVLSIPAIPSLDRALPFEEKSYPKNCYYDVRNRVGTTRAIADRSAGEVTIYINSIPGAWESSESELNASFAFYVVRNEKVTLADVINDQLVNSVSRDNDSKWIVRYKASWIKNLSWDDTLYIDPSAGNAFRDEKIAAPFSKDVAIPVLIRN